MSSVEKGTRVVRSGSEGNHGSSGPVLWQSNLRYYERRGDRLVRGAWTGRYNTGKHRRSHGSCPSCVLEGHFLTDPKVSGPGVFSVYEWTTFSSVIHRTKVFVSVLGWRCIYVMMYECTQIHMYIGPKRTIVFYNSYHCSTPMTPDYD